MNIKSEINQLQKQLLVRLNVRKGTTLFTIIEAITRQAYVKESFVVSQKNSTLADKCKVTASTISRTLKKLKDNCSDLIKIEQNRNVEERFASLVFTFIPQVVSNGEQTEHVKDFNEPIKVAEITSRLTTNPLVMSKNTNKDLIFNNVNNEVDNSNDIHELFLEYSPRGVSKKLFQRVLKEIQEKSGIFNFKAYLRGSLNKVVYHREYRNIKFESSNPILYDWLNE